MKIFRTIAAAALLAAFAALTVNAQQTPAPARPAQGGGAVPDSKVAIINTELFGDPKNGIARLANAFAALDREFKPRRDEVTQLRTRYDQLLKDIDATKAVSDEKALQAKVEQAETLKNDIERKQQDGQRALEKRARELTDPIYNDISNALQAYARQRGISVIFDVSKMAQVMFVVNDAVDITPGFIAEYNQRNPATASTAAPGSK